ncbi:MAG TPA: hypothetical protein PKL85_08080 [Bacteroidia bacterium]|nr:hypothetical protein [Bacteroidia bacterium]
MKKITYLSVLIAAVFSTNSSTAQDSLKTFKPQTVSVEELVGNKRQFLQLTVNKILDEKKNIGLFSISSYAADYKKYSVENEYQNSTLVYHHIFGGISINSGASFTSVEGLKNFVGLQYLHQSKSLTVLLMPTYSFLNNKKVAGLALIEYKPAISQNWALYSRVQVHYNHDLETKSHFRSYAYSRLGFTYKYFSFGFAHNYDRYGAEKSTKNNYGAFLKLSI